MVHAARTMAEDALQRSPASIEWLMLRAEIAEHLGEYPRARRDVDRILAQQGDSLAAIAFLARLLHRQGLSEEAIAACDRGLTIRSDDPALLLQKATVQDQANDYDAAWETLQPLVRISRPLPEASGLASRIMFGLRRYPEALEWASKGCSDAANSATRRTILLHMAKVYDALGRYDEAWDACISAHAIAERRFAPAEAARYFDALVSVFSPRNLRALSRADNGSELPVFVIGMPRSGTTLVEQIIDSHPQAFGAGEIGDLVAMSSSITAEVGSMHVYPDSLADVGPGLANRLADAYLGRLSEFGSTHQRITNKMLEQYEHVGLIWMLFPRARIIHVQRDPLDTCVSCFMRHLNPDRMPYVVNLEHLGLVYRQHERLMRHWRDVLDLPFLSVQYEHLVANQEQTSRQIIDFLGLPWDDRCLRYWESKRTVMTLSYDQVNKPIYDSSIGRWRNYEKRLAPLQRALGQ